MSYRLEMHDDNIEKAIRQAMEEGKFDNLEGKGKPINWDDNPYVSPEEWAINRILKNSGYAPAWIERHKELQQKIDAAHAALTCAARAYQNHRENEWAEKDWERAIARFREQVEKLNKEIRDFNLAAPSVTVHFKLINIEKTIQSALETA